MKTIIFGCGQAGRMAADWLAPGNQLVAYTDNDPRRWGKLLGNVPVIPPDRILDYNPDLVWIAILNREAASNVEAQLLALGYSGTIQSLTPFRSRADLRLAHLRLTAREITAARLPGAVAELGVYQGVFAAEINRLFPDRTLYLFDTFEGFPQKDLEIEAKIQDRPAKARAYRQDFCDTDIDMVLSRLPHPEKAVVCPGRFPESLPENLPKLAFVSLDPDLYEPTRQGLLAFWPRLVPGGVILIHDYNSAQYAGAGQAVREFCRENHLMAMPLADLHGSAILLKQGDGRVEAAPGSL